MKILHLLYSGLGGHGNVFFAMVNADAKHEFEFEALFYGVEDIRPDFIEECKRKNITWYQARKTVFLDLKYYYKILQLIRKSNPDIVFLHGSAYILPAKLAAWFSSKKCKVIIRETQANHLKTKAQWISLSAAMFLANKIVCLTGEFRDQVRQKLKWIYRGKKVHIISNGINLDVYKPTDKSNDQQLTIGMQSRIVKIKDHVTLIKAFALLKAEPVFKPYNLKLKIAGDGELKNELVTLSAELGLAEEIEFTGMLSETDLVTFLQNLDIYVHASLGETMSTSIMQAMACRLPIIASDVAGINNMLANNSTGLLVQPQQPEELATALRQFIQNEELRKSMAQNAHAYAVNNFSNGRMMELYKALF